MSPETLRILFLLLLGFVILMALIRIGAAGIGLLGNLLRSLLDLAIGLAGVGLVVLFFILMFRIDPMPYIRQGAYYLSFQQNVAFQEAIPSNLIPNLNVTKVDKVDTDSDGFKEWVVFYTFDRRGSVGPVMAMVYDNDRGNPPVIFPYSLLPPGRNYLTEGSASLEMLQLATYQDNPENDPLEVIVRGGYTELGIFRFRQNSQEWDFPRDAPPRYQSVGFFRGNGGVQLNDDKSVTVKDRNGYERSQLIVRSIYSLSPVTNTYWDKFYEPTELDRQLAAPTFSTVDFLNGPPDNIYDSTYPEVIVLGFYAANCTGNNNTLCSSVSAGWDPRNFLAEDALTEYDNNNSGYFGLPGFKSIQRLAVTDLRYYPNLETDPDLLPTGGGRDVVTGEAAQQDVVDVTFVVNDVPYEPYGFRMRLVDGKWRITRRVITQDYPAQGAPVQISTSPRN